MEDGVDVSVQGLHVAASFLLNQGFPHDKGSVSTHMAWQKPSKGLQEALDLGAQEPTRTPKPPGGL